MPFVIAVPKEKAEGERRVAIVPEVVQKLTRAGHEIRIETGAGAGAFYPDDLFTAAGAKVVSGRAELFQDARVVLSVQPPAPDDIDQLAEGSIVIGFMNPSRNPESINRMCDRKVTAFALELVPRITRAQSMDALSSQATAGGYAATILGAAHCPKFLPMLTTAAGTIPGELPVSRSGALVPNSWSSRSMLKAREGMHGSLPPKRRPRSNKWYRLQSHGLTSSSRLRRSPGGKPRSLSQRRPS